MTHTYTVNGITCEGCVAKVRHKLLLNPEITDANVTLEGQKAVITMQRHLTLDQLQETIGRDTKYKITEDHVTLAPAGIAGSWISTYKPLLIIGTFLLGVSSITAKGSAIAGMNHFMAGFFLVFSFFKLLDISGFASSYAMYDVIAKRIPAWGYLYPFAELALGIAYLTGFNPVITGWATIVLMGFSSIGVIQSVLGGQKIQCACLGAIFNLPMSTVTIIEDLLMVVMAATMLFTVPGLH